MTTVSENIQHRYEQKFVFEHKSHAFVEQIVKNHPANFHEIFQQRQINNIYFDKPGLKYYSDHIDGNINRKKVRIRWYGNTFGHVHNPILEFKIRKGELGIKISYSLPGFNIEKGFDSNQIKEVLKTANLPSKICKEIDGLEAKLLNSYSRKYYRSFDHHYRFTIDHKLEYFKFLTQQNLFLNKKIDHNNVILELKFGLEFATESAIINTKLPVQKSDFSKYVSGMEKVYSHLVK